MIKLLCISDKGYTNPSMVPPTVGEEYTASDDHVFEGKEYWLINELQNSHPRERNWYRKSDFATLDGLDEASRIDEILEKIFISKQNDKFVESYENKPNYAPSTCS